MIDIDNKLKPCENSADRNAVMDNLTQNEKAAYKQFEADSIKWILDNFGGY